MEKASQNNEVGLKLRGWDALEMKLREKGLSKLEIEEARKSFYDGIEALTRMFLLCYQPEKKSLV